MFLAAAVQMRSGTDRAANEARALSLLGEAADRGAALIGLPEMWEHIGPAREKHAFAGAVDGPQLARIRELCSRRSVFCLAGSIADQSVVENGIDCSSAAVMRSKLQQNQRVSTPDHATPSGCDPAGT